MSKPWAKLEVGYLSHPKFLALPANAICLWHEGKNYCDMHHTDGLIPRDALKTFRFRGAKSIELLMTSCGQKPDGSPYAPLWNTHPVGYQMHDYLDHNDSREVVLERRSVTDFARVQNRFLKDVNRDRALVALIRKRDGNACRYCGCAVNWQDRKGPTGGTYDHVDPSGPNTLHNVVVACRSCNCRKGIRTLSTIAREFGMYLREPKSGPIKPDPGLIFSPTTEAEAEAEETKTKEPLSEPPAPTPQPHPVKAFLSLYVQLFTELHGDPPVIVKGRDPKIAKSTVEQVGEARAHELLRAFFASSDPFIAQAGHGLNVFAGQLNKLIASKTTARPGLVPVRSTYSPATAARLRERGYPA